LKPRGNPRQIPSMRIPFFRRERAIPSLEQTLAELSKATFFAPTPWAAARQMLEAAKPTSADVVYDLGSGDGRIPIMAAQEFGCKAVGIELDARLCKESEDKVREYGLAGQVCFRQEDFFKADLREATIVTLYLLTQLNGYLGPKLASQLRKGSRIVTLDYPVPGWKPELEIPIRSEGNVDYTIFVYRR
jgi:SAM-dependent methyltransferase